MGVADRLATPATGNGDGGIPIAPGGVSRSSKTGLYDTGVNPADTLSAIRPSADVVYNADSLTKDVRDGSANNFGRVVYVNSDAAGADTFTLSFTCPLDILPGQSKVKGTSDDDAVFTTGSLNDDDSAATIQTAIRAALPGTDLTIVNVAGPDFYIIFDDKFWSRGYPTVTFTGTGCTATVTVVSEADQEAYPNSSTTTIPYQGRDNAISQLGESPYVSLSDPILRPTIGTITVTPGVDKVDTLSFSAGTDGGTYEIGPFSSRVLDWDATAHDVYTAVREMFANQPGDFGGVGNAPTVRWATPLSLEVQFVDWDTTDSAVLTYDTTDASDALLYATLTAGATAAAREAIIQDWVKTIDAFVGMDIVATEVTEDQEYDVVFHRTDLNALANTDFVLAVTGTAGEDTSPDENTAFDREAGFTFTYENGNQAGRATVPAQVTIINDVLDDGDVLEPATLTATTAGVMGSASAAYTENSSGSDILACAINDTTGESFGFIVDASSPLAISCPPGAYHFVARTVEDGRVSKADSKAFTMTSA